MAILTSLLDTDLYKLTMMQVVFHQFPSAKVKYAFKCRNKDVSLHGIVPALKAEIAELCKLTFTPEELDYLRKLRFIKGDFVDFLEIFRLQEKHIQIVPLEGGEIDIQIEGPWLHTILFEVPVLALVNELYFLTRDESAEGLRLNEGSKKLAAKMSLLEKADAPEFRFSDFGTRRRYSKEWQRVVVSALKDRFPTQFTGTSNVYLAKELGLVPIGTMAHEYLQAFQALGGRLIDSQKNALDAWAKEYRGDLGIALTDVVGIDAFLRDFDMYFCKLFDGVRHDSGNPVEWMEKMLAHYKQNRVDARTKSFVFSDGLTMQTALDLHTQFKGQGQLFFGIGTHLTNDLGVTPLNVVLKMTECNGQPVAKLSDSPGKAMCKDVQYMDYLKHVFEKK